MGFWTAWAPDPRSRGLSELDWGALTHVIQVGIEPQSDGSLRYSDPNFADNARNLVATAHANNVKALVNIWSEVGSDIHGAVTNNLSATINNIMNIVDTYGYDGIDVDWEGGRNFNSMTILLQNLRSRLGSRILTADAVTNDYAYWGSVSGYLDRVNVMTYDMAGNWNPYSWINSALYGDGCNCVWSVELARQRMTGAGVPAYKLNIGLPFYGWVSSGGGVYGPRQSLVSPPSLSQITYHNLVSNYSLANAQWDSGSQTPYLQTGAGWITYDNERSLAAKIEYTRNNNLGGWIIWAIDQDYMPDQYPRHPLMTAVRNAMGGRAATVTTPAPAPVPAPTWVPAPIVQVPVAQAPVAQAPIAQIVAPVVAPITAFIAPAEFPRISGGLPSLVYVGAPFSRPLSNEGVSGVVWSVNGNVPPGLSINTGTGLISGSPTAAGTYTFQVATQNAVGSDTINFTIRVLDSGF